MPSLSFLARIRVNGAWQTLWSNSNLPSFNGLKSAESFRGARPGADGAPAMVMWREFINVILILGWET